MDISELQKKTIPELFELAKELKIPNYRQFRKHDLVFKILEAKTQSNGLIFAKGVLEILPEGYGFLRTETYLPSADDIYVSQTQMRRFDLANGDLIQGQVRPPKEGEKYFSLLKIEAVNGQDPEKIRERVPFDAMTPIFPDQKIVLEYLGCPMSARLIDLMSPIGVGQRGMIVSPPKAGKTTVLKNIANSVSKNFPEFIIKVLLVDERPEEVTDIPGRSTESNKLDLDERRKPYQGCGTGAESAKRLVEANKM